MNGHDPDLNSRRPGNEGWRTPMIEDDDHPLNMWRSQHSSGTAFESSSQSHSQEEIVNQQTATPQPQGAPVSSRDLRHKLTHHTQHSTHPEHLPWKERLRHTSWAWFTMSMATGGLANVLNAGKLKIDLSTDIDQRIGYISNQV